jgi:hypothetical protein
MFAMAKQKDERVRSTPPPMPPRGKGRKRDDQDDDDGPPRRREPAAGGSGLPLLLILGGVGAVVLLLLVCLVPALLILVLGGRQAANVDVPIAEVNPPVIQPAPEPKPIQKAPPPIANDPFPKDAFKKNPPPIDLAPKVATWNIQPDPGPNMSLPPGNPAAAWQLAGVPEIIYPTTPSPFVALKQGTFGNESWQVVNLQTSQVVGNINGKLDFSNPAVALSPNGKMLAAQGKMQIGKSTVNVVSTADGRLQQSIQLDTQAATLLAVDFGENNSLVTYKTRGLTGFCEVYDIASGRELKRFTKEGLIQRKNNMAFSAGRKYLAVAQN